MEDTNRISLFKAAVDKMIATSEESYKTDMINMLIDLVNKKF